MDADLETSLNYDNDDEIQLAGSADDEFNDETSSVDPETAVGTGEEGDDTENPTIEDNELEGIKARVREMEEEAEKLRQLQREVDQQMNGGVPTSPTGTGPGGVTLSIEEKMEIDARSVYVGNVDYGATAEELEQHFHGAGAVNRVTILCNKFDGHPKGFAYIEFADKESVNASMAFDESLFRGRIIKVMPKRTNRPGLGTRPPRGAGRASPRGFRGSRGFFRGAARFPRRGSGYRGRGTNYYAPY